MNQPAIFWDLETGPLDAVILDIIMPEFTAAKNLKDPDKIAADLATKKADWLDSAALRATTGQIIAAGIANGSNEPEFLVGSERLIIETLLHDLITCMGQGGLIFTWNGLGFDLPFLCQRAAVHNIPAFRQLGNLKSGRFYWDSSFIDAMQVWAGYGQRAGLDDVAKCLGVGVKNGSGKDFAALLVADPVKAKEYCLNDVRLLRDVVGRMGLDRRED